MIRFTPESGRLVIKAVTVAHSSDFLLGCDEPIYQHLGFIACDGAGLKFHCAKANPRNAAITTIVAKAAAIGKNVSNQR